jgi:hypothetical protein
MDENSRTIRQEWVNSLRRNGLTEIVLFMLQAFKPLTFFSSQLIYSGTPLLKFVLSESQITTAGSLMDDSGELDHFMAMLHSKE